MWRRWTRGWWGGESVSVLDQAIRIGRRVPVFPCGPTKKPACKSGFKAAVQEPEKIVELWRKYPGPLIGTPTGERSGIDVLDIDPRHGGDAWLETAVDLLPHTRRHHTRSGGVHILFRHYQGIKNSASLIAPGVDVRGQGGYIIWWPADGHKVENGHLLEDWPIWLRKMLLPEPKRRAPVAVPATRQEADARANRMIARAFDDLRSAPPGQRHYTLRRVAFTLGGLERFFAQGHSDIERTLVEIIMKTGAQDRENAKKTVAWAFQGGVSQPLLTRRG
jgi:hypothetical protein